LWVPYEALKYIRELSYGVATFWSFMHHDRGKPDQELIPSMPRRLLCRQTSISSAFFKPSLFKPSYLDSIISFRGVRCRRAITIHSTQSEGGFAFAVIRPSTSTLTFHSQWQPLVTLFIRDADRCSPQSASRSDNLTNLPHKWPPGVDRVQLCQLNSGAR
jgi:hypothetical protein